MKKIVINIILIILVLSVAGCSNSSKKENSKKKEVNKSTNNINYICTYKNENETTIRTVVLKNGILKQLIIQEDWYYTENHEGLCSNKKYNMEKINKIKGISISGDCDDLKGSYITTYEIEKIADNEDDGLDNVKKIRSYIYENGLFDLDNWMDELKSWDYTCTKEVAK